jgi:hypothetical protein
MDTHLLHWLFVQNAKMQRFTTILHFKLPIFVGSVRIFEDASLLHRSNAWPLSYRAFAQS